MQGAGKAWVLGKAGSKPRFLPTEVLAPDLKTDIVLSLVSKCTMYLLSEPRPGTQVPFGFLSVTQFLYLQNKDYGREKLLGELEKI